MDDSLYEHVGGYDGVHRLVRAWYASVLEDPLLKPLFGPGHDQHVPHVAAFLAEVFGGPTRYTDELGGYPAMLAPHRGKDISEDQRRRFVDLFLLAADDAQWPADARTRDALRGYLDFGSRIAAETSRRTARKPAEDDGSAAEPPRRRVPRWPW